MSYGIAEDVAESINRFTQDIHNPDDCNRILDWAKYASIQPFITPDVYLHYIRSMWRYAPETDDRLELYRVFRDWFVDRCRISAGDTPPDMPLSAYSKGVHSEYPAQRTLWLTRLTRKLQPWLSRYHGYFHVEPIYPVVPATNRVLRIIPFLGYAPDWNVAYAMAHTESIRLNRRNLAKTRWAGGEFGLKRVNLLLNIIRPHIQGLWKKFIIDQPTLDSIRMLTPTDLNTVRQRILSSALLDPFKKVISPLDIYGGKANNILLDRAEGSIRTLDPRDPVTVLVTTQLLYLYRAAEIYQELFTAEASPPSDTSVSTAWRDLYTILSRHSVPYIRIPSVIFVLATYHAWEFYLERCTSSLRCEETLPEDTGDMGTTYIFP